MAPMTNGSLARLISTFGTVTVVRADGTPIAAAAGTVIGHGDTVVTADGAMAGISAGPSLAIGLGSGTRFRLGAAGDVLGLDSGSAVICAAPDGGSPVVRARTPNGDVFIRITSAETGIAFLENGQISSTLLAPPFADGGGALVTAERGGAFLATAFREVDFDPANQTLAGDSIAAEGDALNVFRYALAHLPSSSGFEQTFGMPDWFTQMVESLDMDTAAGWGPPPEPTVPPSFPTRPHSAPQPVPEPNGHGGAAESFTLSPVSARTPTPAEPERLPETNAVTSAVKLNEPPVAFSDTVNTDEDTGVSGVLNAADTDGDTLSFAVVPGHEPANGTVTIAADGSYTYVPNADFFGTDSFTYQVSDGRGGVATAIVTVAVGPVQDAPVATADEAETDKNVPLTLPSDTLIANDFDADGEALSVIGVTNAVNGKVDLTPDGDVVFTPDNNFWGTASFDYVVSDGVGGTDTATVRVDVHNIVRGTEGDDTLRGTADGETVLGLGGDDDLDGKGGDDILYGGDGDDRVAGGAGDDVLYGGQGNDNLYGDTDADKLYGEDGADHMEGGGGDDVLYGGSGDDDMYGDAGADEMHGDAGADILDGGVGNDVLSGGEGGDVLYGGDGNDQLDGGAGNDVLEGGRGADVLSGGEGADVFTFDTRSGSDVVTDIEAGDSLRFEGAKFDSTNLNMDQSGGDVVITFDKVSNVDVTLTGVDLSQQGYTVTQEPDAVVITFDEKD